MNSRHYDNELKVSEELRNLELTMNMADLENGKKTLFRQIYLQHRNDGVLTPRIKICNGTSKMGAITFMLMNVSLQNQISVRNNYYATSYSI